jgi:hypothetical protein
LKSHLSIILFYFIFLKIFFSPSKLVYFGIKLTKHFGEGFGGNKATNWRTEEDFGYTHKGNVVI